MGNLEIYKKSEIVRTGGGELPEYITKEEVDIAVNTIYNFNLTGKS